MLMTSGLLSSTLASNSSSFPFPTNPSVFLVIIFNTDLLILIPLDPLTLDGNVPLEPSSSSFVFVCFTLFFYSQLLLVLFYFMYSLLNFSLSTNLKTCLETFLMFSSILNVTFSGGEPCIPAVYPSLLVLSISLVIFFMPKMFSMSTTFSSFSSVLSFLNSV